MTVEYIMDLEALVRWLALTFSWQDPETGEVCVNDPIWSAFDFYGTPLPAAQKLQETWDKVIHDECCDLPSGHAGGCWHESGTDDD